MSRIKLGLIAGVGLIALAACSQAPTATASLVGARVDDFQLIDQEGVAHTLKYNKAAPAVVLAAHVTGDEGALAAAAALADLQAKHPEATVLMVNSSATDDRDTIAAEAAAKDIKVAVLDDPTQLIGESLGFTYAGETVVVDPKTWTVAYHGKAEAAAAAVEALKAGQPVETASVAGKGLVLEFPDRARKGEFATISYATEIAPILEANCVACHSPGGIAPFAMTNYDVVKGFAPMIREAIRTDRMPPYNADAHVGAFQEYANLSVDNTRTLIHWIEAGAPRGEGDDPLLAHVKPREDWPLGKPDLVVDIPKFAVPASGYVDYQTPAVASPIKEAKWLKATAFKAGSREGVHHILAGWIPKLPEGGKGDFSWDINVGGYAVGREVNLAPEGWGTLVPPGGALSFQMHYTPFGKETVDDSKIGFYFSDTAPEKVMRQIVAVDPTIMIAPNTSRHHERAYVQFPAAIQLYGAQPHAHYRGYSSKLTARFPDGTEKVLLNLPKYDFGYQQEYVFKDLIDLPAGTILIADYLYDNSANNPVLQAGSLADPNKEVAWGDQSFEEMLFTAIRYRWADETSANRRDDLQAQLESQTLFTAVDDNINGKWEVTELRTSSGAGVTANEGLGAMMTGIKENFAALDADKDGGLNPQEVGAALKQMQEERRRQIDARRSAGGQR